MTKYKNHLILLERKFKKVLLLDTTSTFFNAIVVPSPLNMNKFGLIGLTFWEKLGNLYVFLRLN